MVSITTIAIIGGAVVLFLIIAGLGIFFFFMRKKGSKKYPFIFYSMNGEKAQIIYANVVIDPTNKNKKTFTFPNSDNTLDIKPPSIWLEGKPHRQATYNDLGEVSYVKAIKLNNSKYRELAISPEEKTLALHRYKENISRYENPLNKAQLGLMIGGFILVLLIGIGIIYSTITYANVVKDHVKIIESGSANVKVIASTTKQMSEVVERIAQITAALTGNANLTRQVS